MAKSKRATAPGPQGPEAQPSEAWLNALGCRNLDEFKAYEATKTKDGKVDEFTSNWWKQSVGSVRSFSSTNLAVRAIHMGVLRACTVGVAR